MQERRHRHLPAAADLADDVLDRHLHVGEEDLVELGLAGDLAERPHLDAGRVHVDEQVGEPGVALAVGIAARDEDAPVGDVRERRPDLLAVDDEVVALERESRGRAHGGEVGARVRLGEALAPDLLGREDLLQVLLLLGVGAVRDDRRAGHAEPDHAEVGRRLGARHLLEEDRLVAVRSRRRRRTPSARSGPRSRPRSSFRLQSRPASSKRPRRISSVRFVSIHARSSARKAASSGVSRRSTRRL